MSRSSRPAFPILLALALAVAAGTPVTGDPEPSQASPRVVVLVVVDQLRADLLDRYDEVFTGGFRRLRDEGFRFEQATHDHAITFTAPGHATIVTGVTPRKHGVVSNAWFQVGGQGWEQVDNVLDAQAPLVEAPTVRGASPRVLMRHGLADWLQAAHPDAKVVSVSGKARAAVLMASHSRADVYWYEEGLGRFVSSTHYLQSYPEWVTSFNQEALPPFAADSAWTLAVPERFRSLAWKDSAAWEGDGIHTAFPHTFAESEYLASQGAFWVWWGATPPLDAATRLMAQAAADANGIGQDEVPDLLAVSFSQTDRVGHAYGPRSLEQLDNLYRLDRELGEFLAWLDGRFGPDGYVLLLTADHGMADDPEITVAEGGRALRVTRDSAMALQQVVNSVAGEVGIQDAQALARGLAERLPGISWIEQAWTFADLQRSNAGTDSFTVMQERSTYPGRYTGILARQGVEVRYVENSLLWAYPRGSTHGSPYLYDRQVPFVLFGSGIPHGSSSERVSTNDVAPTLAAILGLRVPEDLDGVVRRAGEGGGAP